MPRLIARNLDGEQAAIALPPDGSPVSIGRGEGCDLALPFEGAVSRRHGTAVWRAGQATLTCDPAAKNGFLLPADGDRNDRDHDRDRPHRTVALRPGESAIIGRTQLTFVSDVDDSPGSSLRRREPIEAAPDDEYAITPLPEAQVDDDQRLSVLSRLPDVLDGALDESERLHRVAALVLVGVRSATWSAIVRTIDNDTPEVLAWDRRAAPSGDASSDGPSDAGPPRVSGKLVAGAIAADATIVHAWYGEQAEGYTVADDCDWTFATPYGRDRAIVVSGSGRGIRTPARQLDAKFVEVTAELLRTERENRELNARLGQLRQFFSTPVMRTIEEAVAAGGVFESELLAPRECELAVLFCDLRGFSADVERSDDLLGELQRVREALGVMSQAVLDHGGVTGEFLGDAVLGFWGWPIASDGMAIDCARAALQIAQTLGRDDNGQPAHGIGLAVGRAVAGRITTGDRTSVNAFGPALNLASRLQTLTRQLRVPIVADAAFRERAAGLSPDEGRFRLLGRVVPYGLSEPVDASELVPPAAGHSLSDEQLARYEAASHAFIAGDWDAASRDLRGMPDEDRAADFLIAEMLRHNRTAPPSWDGAIRVERK